jgi:hypothetical protein
MRRGNYQAATVLLVSFSTDVLEPPLTISRPDQTFAGSLLSAVTCSSCHTTSTTIDPILDVQLDFPKHAPGNGTLTLAGMLRRYCAEERVGELGKGYECSNCGGGPGVVSCFKRSYPTLTIPGGYAETSDQEACSCLVVSA